MQMKALAKQQRKNFSVMTTLVVLARELNKRE